MRKSIGETGLAYLWGKITSSLSGKESKREIVAPVNTADASLPITSLSCELGKYYRIDVAVETLSITLPGVTDYTHTNSVVIMLTTGESPNVTFISSLVNNIEPDVYAEDGFFIGANKSYKIIATYNGNYWSITSIEIDKTDIQPSKFIVSGVVTDGVNALSGVVVTIGYKTTTTDNEGAYSLSVRAGSYTLQATKTDYSFSGVEITVSADMTQNIVMLPYDAEVEYLETDGNAYINTGVTAHNKITFNLKFHVPQGTARLFGETKPNSALLVSKSSEYYKWSWGTSSANGAAVTDSTPAEDHTFSNIGTNNNRVCIMDGTIQMTASIVSFNSNLHIYIFGINNNGTFAAGTNGTRLYSGYGKIYSNGTLVRDYIAVRKNGVGYLYDKVSGTLFGNANSVGTFTYGNDKT